MLEGGKYSFLSARKQPYVRRFGRVWRTRRSSNSYHLEVQRCTVEPTAGKEIGGFINNSYAFQQSATPALLRLTVAAGSTDFLTHPLLNLTNYPQV